MTAALTEYDALVSAIVAAGAPRAKAELVARERLGMPKDPQMADRDARIRENAEQREIIKLFREHGFTVRSTSQYRPSKIAIGFPDLFCTHKTLPLAFFFESKRQVGGVVSDAQREFGNDCWRCGVRWYAGDRYNAQQLLNQLNVSRPI